MYIGKEKKSVHEANLDNKISRGEVDWYGDMGKNKDAFFSNVSGKKEGRKKEREVNELAENDFHFEENRRPKIVFHEWQAPEYEIYEKDRKWYVVMGLLLAFIIIYAIFTDGLVMAITFILIGVVAYIILNKKPRVITFYITDDGIVAGREIYEFENINSFWIFYEPEGIKVVSLHVKSKFSPYIHIPIENEDPLKIREIILNYIEEKKHHPTLIDAFERILRV